MKNRMLHVFWVVRSELFKTDTLCVVRELEMSLVRTRRKLAFVVSRDVEQCLEGVTQSLHRSFPQSLAADDRLCLFPNGLSYRHQPIQISRRHGKSFQVYPHHSVTVPACHPNQSAQQSLCLKVVAVTEVLLLGWIDGGQRLRIERL